MSARLNTLRARIGGQVAGMRGVFPGPAHSRHDRSLSLWDLGDRVLAYSFSGDDWGEITGYLAANGVDIIGRDAVLTRAEKVRYAKIMREARAEQERDDERKKAKALALFHKAETLSGAAEIYLRQRGIASHVIAEARDYGDLRFAPECPTSPYSTASGRTQPAMVALVRDRYGAELGAHITYLRRDGTGKAGDKPRLMLGKQRGGCIRLGPPAATLAVAEGIETALSYATLHGVTCWAARSAVGLEQFRPPDGPQPVIVTRTIIAADADNAGLTAADALHAMLRLYMRAEIHAPPMAGDWNDALAAQLCASTQPPQPEARSHVG